MNLLARYSLAVFLWVGVVSLGYAQKQKDEEKAAVPCTEMTNKKAIKLYEKGTDKKNHNLEEKAHYLKDALALEPDYVEALFAYGDAQRRMAKVKGTSYEGMVKCFERINELCPTYNPYTFFYLAQYYYGKDDLKKTIQLCKEFLKNADNAKNDQDYAEAEAMKSDAEFYDKILNNPVPFNPEAVEGVSSGHNEYLAILSHDNEMCLYTRKLPVNYKDKVYASDRMAEVFMYSRRKSIDDKFDNGTMFVEPFMAGENYGGASLTVDNKTMYITICKQGKMGYMNCDIYESHWSDAKNEWSKPEALGPNINSPDGWESQPSISADGKMLVFATARANSRAQDIFVSSRDENGEWTKAQSLSPKINTDGNEKTPFLHSDSRTLYFSSDGRRGLGGYDIFFTRMNEKGEWSAPKNLGSPINTENDEYGFFVSIDGHIGYFASSNLGTKSKGGIDIYSFELYKEARPEKVILLKGELKNMHGDPIDSATVEIKNPKTNEVTKLTVDPERSSYVGIIRAPKNDTLVMTVSAPRQVPAFKVVTPKDSASNGRPVVTNLELNVAKKGGTYTINDINYHTNSSKLTRESFLVLDELAAYMKTHDVFKIAIYGHTDSQGDDKANLALSTDRAFSVYDYLMSKGIDKNHMSFKGFGEVKPIAPNDTEENRAKNRRTEFVITEM